MSLDDKAPLSENLAKYRVAMEQELSRGTDPVAEAKNKLSDLLLAACSALEDILLHSDSDSTRMTAVKLVFEHTLGKASPGEDELSRIMSELTKA